MDARNLLTNIISFVGANIHERRCDAFVQSLMNDNVASATNIGRDIRGKMLEKYRIKRADHL